MITWQNVIDRAKTGAAAVRQRFPLRRIAIITGIAATIGLVAVGTEAGLRGRISPVATRQPTSIYTRPVAWNSEDELIAPVAIGTIDGRMMEERVPVALDRLPDHLIDAILAVEDQRFFAHEGLDVRRIGGALVANIRAGGIAQGGSTITQQLAKNLFLSADRTPLRKIREAALAVALEIRHDKREILEAYVNEIYLGQDRGRALHGVGAASRYYFGKPAARLTLAESALLAGMIHAPNRHAPTRNPQSALQRRNLVLQLMADQGRVTQADADRARRVKISTRAHATQSIDARFFRDYVAAHLPARMPVRGGAVYTTLDASLQAAAERAVQLGLARMKLPGAEAALVAIDPRTGEILAMVGGRQYGASQFNRATDARRQPGSAFKPIVALAALEPSGDDAPAFTLASVVDDEPLRVETASGPWEPVNYDRTFHGPVTVRRAMEQSLNIPFVRMGLAVGPDRVMAMARRVGITSPLAAVPSLALGSSEVSLLELVRAYGVLAAGGDLVPTRAILAHGRGGSDSVVVTAAGTPTRAVDPAVAYLVTSALEGVVTRGTARALSGGVLRGELAGKTGTSNNWRDAWFVAYTPNVVIGVWVGYDDGRTLKLTGAGAALPIAARFLGEARLPSGDGFEVPDGITESYVGIDDGGWPQVCGAREVFLQGTEPAEECVQFVEPQIEDEDGWVRSIGRSAQRLLRGIFGRPPRPPTPDRSDN